MWVGIKTARNRAANRDGYTTPDRSSCPCPPTVSFMLQRDIRVSVNKSINKILHYNIFVYATRKTSAMRILHQLRNRFLDIFVKSLLRENWQSFGRIHTVFRVP